MSKGTILITDSLFISKENENSIREGGYEIERLDVPKATEEQLVEAIKDKVGYIIGGVEHVTERVIDAGNELKCISLTGIGYKDFIPAHEYATEKGVAITNTPDGPTQGAAEWAVTAALAMERHLLELGGVGEKTFMTSQGIEGATIGIVGYGRIGHRIEAMITPFAPAQILHTTRSSDSTDAPLQDLLQQSDIVFVCVSKDAGADFISTPELAQMKSGALLVSFMATGIINEAALLKELQSSRIRAISDYPMKDIGFKSLPLAQWYCNNETNAWNTTANLKRMSDTATQSLLNVLGTGKDRYRVN